MGKKELKVLKEIAIRIDYLEKTLNEHPYMMDIRLEKNKLTQELCSKIIGYDI